MKSKCLLLPLAFAAVLALTSCSGSNHSCTNCTSNATVNVTLFDIPPTGLTILSYSLPIVGISLTPSTGTAVSIYSPTTIVPTELTRLQTESALIAMGVQVPAGSYTAINVTLATSGGVFVNATSSVLNSTCAVGAVCPLSGAAATTVSIPMQLTLSGGQATWIGLDVNLNNAITTSTAGTVAVDFTQANTFTATTTPRVGTPSGAFDTIGDFIGSVTALSNASITVQNTISGQSLTAALNSSTQFDAAPSTYSNCSGSCIAKGSVVSMDAALTTSSTLTATEIDVLDAAATDEVEGVIYPTTTAGIIGMILADKTSTGDSPTLGAATTTYGTGIFVGASSTISYVIDTKNLTNNPGIPPLGFAGSGDLLAGQQIRAHVTGVTTNTISGIATIQATATNVLLRWSRISGSINTASLNLFTMTGIPQYINSLNTTLSLTPLVTTYTNGTLFDGVTGTTDPNFAVGKPVAIRALYLNNASQPFQAAKVRVP
jgi:hypothetical protein